MSAVHGKKYLLLVLYSLDSYHKQSGYSAVASLRVNTVKYHAFAKTYVYRYFPEGMQIVITYSFACYERSDYSESDRTTSAKCTKESATT